jgi:hypothetical protein
MHRQTLHSLFAALRQNRVQKTSYGRSSFFALMAQKKMNDFDAQRQRVSVKFSGA